MCFCSSYDLELDLMNLAYELDLDIPRLSKVGARTGQTHTKTDATERITTPHSQVVETK